MKTIIESLQKLKSPVGLAISGGVDSMVLAHLLLKAGHKPILLHVNYKKRGIESDKDQKFIEEFANKNDLLFICNETNSKHNGGNFQNWARQVRYRWFEEVKLAQKINTILTAHHLDDQLETLVFRLMRGNSLSSLQGIPKYNGYLFRPLLDTPKRELVDYALNEHIEWRHDRSNDSATYDRNYIRLHIIPLLDKKYIDWRQKLNDVSSFASFFNETMHNVLNTCMYQRQLNRTKWLNYRPNIRKNIIKLWLINTFEIRVNKSFLENIDAIEALQTGKRIEVNNSYSITRDRDWFHLISRNSSPTSILKQIFKNDVEPSTSVIVDGMLIEKGVWGGKPNKFKVELDILKIRFPLTIRTWQKGDRMNPLGMTGSKLVSDILIDNRIPSIQKNEVLVIQAFDSTIIAVILPRKFEQLLGIISNDIRCSKSTITTLTISLNKQ